MFTEARILKRLFSSRLRVSVLSHFFMNPGESFHIRSLATILSESAGNLARELNNLEEVGLLQSRAVGNQKHFSVILGDRLPQRTDHFIIDSVLALQHIGMDDLDIPGLVELLRRDARQYGIVFNGDDKAGDFAQRLGEGARAAADFQHHILGVNMGAVAQQLHQVQVDEEMLTQPLIRRDTRRGEQLYYLLFRLHVRFR